MVDTIDEEKALFPERAGDRLRAARTGAGMDLSDVASRTRIPLRHLQAIEAGDYSSFPSSTYCVGFVKAYARAVGEDEVELSRQVRIELGQDAYGYRTELQDYDDADPARIPSRTLVWTAAAIFLLVAIGYGVWRSQMLSEPEVGSVQTETSATPRPTTAPAVAAPSALNASGEVALTAIEPVWLRIYDAADKVLFEKEMAKGERYVVPSDADNPRIRTGRADLIAVTINGSAVPALGPGERTVKDIGVSAAALLARPPAGAPSVPAIGNTAPPNIAPLPIPSKKPRVTNSRPQAETVREAPTVPTEAVTTAPAPATVTAPPTGQP